MAGDQHRLRLGVLAVVAFSLFAALFARLYYLQVMVSPAYQVQVERNTVRTVELAPERGRILDRNGVPLAKNTMVIQVVVSRDAIRNERRRIELFNRLAPLLDTTPEELESRARSSRYDPLLPLPLAESEDKLFATRVAERADEFPGVSVETVPRRVYPFGWLAAHVVGYVGAIPKDELKAFLDKGYAANELVGVSGIERVFEDELRGKPGYRKVEVDNAGRVVRLLDDYQPPVPGNDVQLTIDLKVQYLTERALAQGLAEARQRTSNDEPPRRFAAPAGVAVVQDPNDGSVLAMASNPTYDPRIFVDPQITAEDRTSLLDPIPDDGIPYAPLVNKAVQGEYAPASTFKLISAIAMLSWRLPGHSAYRPYLDQGFYKVDPCRDGDKCTYSNAGRQAFGFIDLPEAIAVSSDAYFYAVGADFWIRRTDGLAWALQRTAEYYGFGQQTGIQLPSEQDGRVPNAAVKKALVEANPAAFQNDPGFRIGDNMQFAVGMGLTAATPMQITNAYSAFANGGTLYSPNIVRRILAPGTAESRTGPVAVREVGPRVLRTVSLPPEVRTPVMEGLLGALTRARGTATRTFAGFDLASFPIAGKTGTAQGAPERSGPDKGKILSVNDNSLFAAFGPANSPRWTVTAVLEKAGFGSQSAAPVVRAIFEGLIDYDDGRNPDALAAPEPLPAASGQIPVIPPLYPDGRPLPGSTGNALDRVE